MTAKKNTTKNAAKQPAKKRITFNLKADPGSEVSVAGTFNDWTAGVKPMKDKKNDGNFSAVAILPKGKYEYKFVVNGVWCIDPENEDWLANDMGSLNSVLVVK